VLQTGLKGFDGGRTQLYSDVHGCILYNVPQNLDSSLR
jgi:hypothetical protein